MVDNKILGTFDRAVPWSTLLIRNSLNVPPRNNTLHRSATKT